MQLEGMHDIIMQVVSDENWPIIALGHSVEPKEAKVWVSRKVNVKLKEKFDSDLSIILCRNSQQEGDSTLQFHECPNHILSKSKEFANNLGFPYQGFTRELSLDTAVNNELCQLVNGRKVTKSANVPSDLVQSWNIYRALITNAIYNQSLQSGASQCLSEAFTEPAGCYTNPICASTLQELQESLVTNIRQLLKSHLPDKVTFATLSAHPEKHISAFSQILFEYELKHTNHNPFVLLVQMHYPAFCPDHYQEDAITKWQQSNHVWKFNKIKWIFPLIAYSTRGTQLPSKADKTMQLKLGRKSKMELKPLKVIYHPTRQSPMQHMLTAYSIFSLTWTCYMIFMALALPNISFFDIKGPRKLPSKW
ncbi:hypothetical protein PHYBLDRAFT_138960 [Phycomyces blakesleeanus NRRL 1555(-)]|uniref:Uncharacterized protein n=1 Tax=Phycomyces blakesleeanus (strain ATCC 8743b / DSM 1359 / FGSC 10004 / NBRC 33097 / NRRL 1555) TaxID=763407 RepID=A0A163ET35_PHYB8|nr:hypothetical protein PHYBLDRAFT_138960 [Phycomyces blakesleeanus NRRL 1555(-)]OAD81410.1 hypothetical protein PHYBLDRAFT_138960 [Phycomyces blakesleeanus NRRL 1555(-)]|eukprot:XP_018299450.1 hypothetical protein PHYBLDRAFT_138960 [Phycomyces blakesleeanus NRRL 1555(-)]